MKQKLYWVLFVSILLVAAMIRFYQLGSVPHGMTWDEAAIGYNGSAIWRTRRDEWLVRLPVSFRSFGDYKAPLAIYLNGLFTAVLGLNLLAVRLPFTLASLVAIAAFMLLIKALTKEHQHSDRLSLLGGVMLTLSPWHIHYSRAGFESGMALALLLTGLWLFVTAVEVRKPLMRIVTMSASAVLLALTLYTYHSAKVVTPLLVVIFLLLCVKKIKKSIPTFLIATLIGVGLLIPFVKDSIYGEGLQRIDSSILNDQSGMELLATIGKNMLIHLSPAFLVQGTTTTLRHGGAGWGVLQPVTLMLAMCGLVFFIFSLFKKKMISGQEKKLFGLAISWILIGVLPAAIGEEIPHSNRALLALPGFLMLALLGGMHLIKLVAETKYNRMVEGSHHEHNQVVKAVFGILMLIYAVYSIGFVHYYFTDFAADSADAFKDGYVEAFANVKEYENQVDKILFTSDYGQPYIYALFVRKTNPIWYQGGSLIKYEFAETISAADLERPNTIVVASEMDDTPLEKADKVVYGSDGLVRFKIYYPPELQ